MSWTTGVVDVELIIRISGPAANAISGLYLLTGNYGTGPYFVVAFIIDNSLENEFTIVVNLKLSRKIWFSSTLVCIIGRSSILNVLFGCDGLLYEKLLHMIFNSANLQMHNEQEVICKINYKILIVLCSKNLIILERRLRRGNRFEVLLAALWVVSL